MIEVYVDGSCKGNEKHNSSGGFAVVIIKDGVIEYTYDEHHLHVTNNFEELSAILHAYQVLIEKYPGETATIYSDSFYCINCITEWAFSWKQYNWRRYGNQPILNLDLIKKIHALYCEHFYEIDIKKVMGHVGIAGNELCDCLAKNDHQKFETLLKEYGYRQKIEIIEKI